jgi:hypothetical protein
LQIISKCSIIDNEYIRLLGISPRSKYSNHFKPPKLRIPTVQDQRGSPHPLGEPFNHHDLTFNPPPSDTPRVTPQPLREPAPKPWMEPRPIPPVVDEYVPTEADRTRWAQERQAFFDEQRRLVHAELQQIKHLEHAN